HSGLPSKAHFRYKMVRTSQRRQVRTLNKWRADGWELVSEDAHGRGVRLTFRKALSRRRIVVFATAAVVLISFVGLIAATVRGPVETDAFKELRAESAAAVRDLQAGNLVAMDGRLAKYRGDPEFAYFFTSKVSPRMLGDALAEAVGSSGDGSLRPDLDPH